MTFRTILLTGFGIALLASCKNKAENQWQDQSKAQVSANEKFLAEEAPFSTLMEQTKAAVNNLPEKFKKENPEAYEKMQQNMDALDTRRNIMLSDIQKANTEIANLKNLSEEEAKLNFQNRIVPMVERAQDAVKRYDKFLNDTKMQLDSLAKVYNK